MKVILFFPPGWSFTTGSPYLSTPLLSATLIEQGFDVEQQDLNKGFANYYNVRVTEDEIKNSVYSFEGLNKIYFEREDRLNHISKDYKGSWNLQLGFTHDKYNNQCSQDIKEALTQDTAFDSYYKSEVIPLIENKAPKLIAFSIVEQNQLIPSLRLVYLLKASGFDGYILFGGNLITRLKEEIKNDWFFELIDFAITFQGETPFVRLLESLVQKESLEDVPSLIWRNNDRIQENDLMQKDEQNPNNIPAPNFDGLDLKSYWGINYLPLVHLRGCYFGRCSFCPIPFAWGFGGFAGKSTVEKLFFEMSELYKKYGIFRFQLVDEAFTSHSAIALSKLIIENNAPFEWMVFARFEKKWGESKVANLLSKGGLRKIHLGLEILNTSNRSALGKKDYDANIDDVIKVLFDNNIKLHLFCLFGFPGTSIYDAELTMNYILENKEMIDSVDINPFQLYKHTSVGGVQQIHNSKEDWAIRYDYKRLEDGLTNKDIELLTDEYEKILWQEKYTLLHPLYRIYSPWKN